MVGMRSLFTCPKTASAVVVTALKEPVAAEMPFKTLILEALRYWIFAVLETLRMLVVTPPKKVTGTLVVAPFAVTVARVSVEAPIEGQFTPLEVQTS